MQGPAAPGGQTRVTALKRCCAVATWRAHYCIQAVQAHHAMFSRLVLRLTHIASHWLWLIAQVLCSRLLETMSVAAWRNL
jgi:hypothetical protein